MRTMLTFALVALLLGAFALQAQTDFAPHDLTSASSHSPYFVDAVNEFTAEFYRWKAFDGVANTRWLANGMAQSLYPWLLLDLDIVNGVKDISPHDLTSNTSHSPIVTSASSEYSPDYPPWKTNDGGTGFWGGVGGSNWIKYDFGDGNAFVLASYTIWVHTVDMPSTPKVWTMQGSDDDSNWYTIDTVVNQTGWGAGEARSYSCDTTSTPYRYFMLVITENNGGTTINIREMNFYRAAVGIKKKLASYSIKIILEATYAPKAWTMQGSNDRATWDVLDTVSGETDWEDGETRNYTNDVATTTYQFFRIYITENNGSDFTSIAELNLWEGATSSIKSVSAVVLVSIKKVAGVAIAVIKSVAGVPNV